MINALISTFLNFCSGYVFINDDLLTVIEFMLQFLYLGFNSILFGFKPEKTFFMLLDLRGASKSDFNSVVRFTEKSSELNCNHFSYPFPFHDTSFKSEERINMLPSIISEWTVKTIKLSKLLISGCSNSYILACMKKKENEFLLIESHCIYSGIGLENSFSFQYISINHWHKVVACFLLVFCWIISCFGEVWRYYYPISIELFRHLSCLWN